MNQWYVSQSLDTYLQPQPDELQIPGSEGAWEILDQLLVDLEGLVIEQPTGQSAAMCSLVGLFEADAAGLYIAPRPGRPMELVDQCRFPDSGPDQLGSSLLTQAGSTDYGIIQSRILDARIGIWSAAANESGWRQILDYLLPYRMARLVLAFKEPLPRLVDRRAKVALRALVMTINHKQTVDQVGDLNRRNEELDHLLQTGSNNLTEGAMVLDSEGRILLCNSVGGQVLGMPGGDCRASGGGRPGVARGHRPAGPAGAVRSERAGDLSPPSISGTASHCPPHCASRRCTSPVVLPTEPWSFLASVPPSRWRRWA